MSGDVFKKKISSRGLPPGTDSFHHKANVEVVLLTRLRAPIMSEERNDIDYHVSN